MGISRNQLKAQNHTVHEVQVMDTFTSSFFLSTRQVYPSPQWRRQPHHYADSTAYEQSRIEHRHQLLLQHKAPESASLQHPQYDRR